MPPIDIEYGPIWIETALLRWYRPPGGNDNEVVLEQQWVRINGPDQSEWRPVPLVLAD